MNGGALNYRGLTLKQSWLAHYFFTPTSETFGNIAGSARKARYRGNPRTLAVVGFKTLRSTNMLPEVRRRMKTVMSSEETLQEITGIAQREVSDYKPSDKLKALELLAKFHKLLTDKVESTDTTERDAAVIAISESIERSISRSNLSENAAAIQLYASLDDSSPARDLTHWGKYADVIRADQRERAEKLTAPDELDSTM